MNELNETTKSPKLRLNIESVRQIKYQAKDGVPAPESSVCSISHLTGCCGGSDASGPGCCP